MRVNKFITIIAFALSITSLSFKFTDKAYCWILTFIITCVLISFLFWLENKLRDSQGAIINKIFYFVSKNRDPYIIDCLESCYEYKSKKEMCYQKIIYLTSRVNNLQKYQDKYSWSSYSKGIIVTPLISEHSITYLSSRNEWNVIEINFNARVKKKESIKTGITITGLKDEDEIAKPFLSAGTSRKVKERILTVKIPELLKPKNARFEVYMENSTDGAIKSELLDYDINIQGFTKIIRYPRPGWLYSIVWEWE